MKRVLTILSIILLSPILLIGLIVFILLMPIERFRYHRSFFYKDSQIKYQFLATQSMIYKAYVVSKQYDVPLSIIKDENGSLAIEHKNHLYYELNGNIQYKDGWVINTGNKESMNLDDYVDTLLMKDVFKDKQAITFLIDKNLMDMDKKEAFIEATLKHDYVIVEQIETLVALLDTEGKITNVKVIYQSLPVYIHRVLIALILLVESIMLLISNQAIESLLRRITISTLLIIPLSLSVIAILSSGLFKKPYVYIKKALVERFITLLLFLVLLLVFFISDSGYYF